MIQGEKEFTFLKIFKRTMLLVTVLLLFILSGCLDVMAPVSDAGRNQQVLVGSTVHLDGSDSYDSDGGIVEFKWRLTHKPEGSLAFIEFPDDEFPTFFADLMGIYIAELVVFDGELYSGRDVVVITAINNSAGMPPVPVFPPMAPPGFPPPGMPPYLPPPPSSPPPHTPPTGIPSPYNIPKVFVAMRDSPIQISAFLGSRGLIQESKWVVTNSPEDAVYSFDTPMRSMTTFEADTVGDYQLLFTQRLLRAENEVVRGITVLVQVQENEFSLNLPPMLVVGKPIYVGLRATTEMLESISQNGVINDDVNTSWSMTYLGNALLDSDLNKDLENSADESVENPIINGVENESGIITKFLREGVLGAVVIVDTAGEYELAVKVTSGIDEFNLVIVLNINVDINSNHLNGLDHSMLVDECVLCHNGVDAIGKNVSHLNTSDQCESCHTIVTMMPVIRVDHSQVLGDCVSCHNGIVAIGKGVNHLNTSDQCDACHNTVNFLPVDKADHAEVIGNCSSCHDGVISVGMNAEHIIIPEAQQCNECHSTQMFKVTEEKAILLGLYDDEVNTWYESIGRSIFCGTNENGLLAVNDYVASSIATPVPVPESAIHCRATLNKTEQVWEIIYRNIDSAGSIDPINVKFTVRVDAIKGVILP